MHHFFTHMAGMDFSWKGVIGPGLAINHGWEVIGADVVIGMNATIFHGVTLGRRRVYSKENDGRYVELFPTLENDVWIGPNAMIFGNVTIGEGAKVGPGAYVAFDVDPFCLVLSEILVR